MKKFSVENPVVRRCLALSLVLMVGVVCYLGNWHSIWEIAFEMLWVPEWRSLSHFGRGLLVFGCVAPVFAGCVAPVFAADQNDDRFVAIRTAASVGLLFLGFVAAWAGKTGAFFSTNQPFAALIYLCVGWIPTGAFYLGSYLVTLLFRLLISLVWRLTISPTETSPEDRVLHDQLAQTTSVPEDVDGVPYQKPATSD